MTLIGKVLGFNFDGFGNLGISGNCWSTVRFSFATIQ